MNLNAGNWKPFRFEDLISKIYKAKAYKDEDLIFVNKLTNFSIPYVTRTDLNNGVKSFVLREELENIEKGNALVVGDTTATVSYQKDDFIAGDHIVVIRAEWLNEYTGLFIASILQKEKYRYSYGRAFKMKVIKNTIVKLPINPNNAPDYDFMEQYIKSLHYKPIMTTIKQDHQHFDTDSWKTFRIKDLFTLENCKCSKAKDLLDGDDIWYIGAKKDDNGRMKKVALDNNLVSKGNCIIFICDGQGSVGYSNYMDRDFIGSTTLMAGYNTKLNKYIGLFLVTLLDLNRPRYSFGRKWKTHLADTEIKLPVTSNGNPDYQYMENYIKSLPYSDRI